ncbi:MAG: hypothetical protein ACREYF_15970 [Gammaproteobacteria bacterium]
MTKKDFIRNEPATSVLPTEFVTPEQTAALTKVVDLALEDLNEVAGGIVDTSSCQCVNCCSSH